MLSIIIPVRNESNIIHEVFDYFSNNLKDIQYEVLIINDFSNDDTFDKCKKLVDEYKNFRIFDNPKKGLGGAINLGINEAKGDNISIMMADLSDDIDDLKRYNVLMEQGNFDAILGSRFTRIS